MIGQITSPHRVKHCLKRVGERGERRWERISFETLIEEICAGGDLLGEGQVDGLRAIHNHDEPVDAAGENGHTNATHLVIEAGGDLKPSRAVKKAALFVERQIVINSEGSTLEVKSSLTKLRDTANEHSLEDYAEHCGIDPRIIKRIAERPGPHTAGKRAWAGGLPVRPRRTL